MAIDPNIKQKAENIRLKKKGREVRESLAAGLEAMSEDVVETVDRQDYVESQFQEVIDNTTGKDVISAPELIAARNGETNLKARLDKEQQQVNAQLAQTVQTVNVKAFGAIGDGVADDGQAILMAHLYANDVGGLVHYPFGDYYISEVSKIPIKTSVDFYGSTIIINDSATTVDIAEELFSVIEEDGARVEHINDSLTAAVSSKFNRQTKKVPELAGNGMIFVEIYDDSDLILARYGNYVGGVARPKSDIVKIDNQGNLLSEMTYDFKKVTRLVIHSIPEKKVVLKNGHFKSVGENSGDTNSYYRRNIRVSRSNVTMDNISHEIEDFVGKAPAHGFIRTEYCCDINIFNSDFQPRLSNSSYEISNFMTLNLLFDNVNAESNDSDVWGAHVGYLMKNVKFRNCKINRIDSHLPSHNIDIDLCDIGTKGITVTGFGKLNIRNTSVKSSSFLNLREDYGSFWNGSIKIDNVDHYPTTTPRLFSINPTIDWNFGVDTFFGNEGVEVNKYRLHDKGLTSFTPYLIYFANDSAVKTPARDYYKLGKNISFKDCTTDSGNGFALFYMLNYRNLRAMNNSEISRGSDGSLALKENIVVELENIKMDSTTRFPNATHANVSNLIQPLNSTFDYTAVNGYSLDHLSPKFVIRNCEDVYASVRGLRAIIDIEDSRVVTLMNYIDGGSNAKVSVKDSVIEPRFDTASSVKYVIRTNYATDTFINCEFKLPRSTVGRIFPSDDTQFVAVYTLFDGFRGRSRIGVSAKLIGCSLDPDFNQSILNPDIGAFDVTLENMVNQYYYRKIGSTSNRPYMPKSGLTYYDTDLKKPITFNGINWVDATGNNV